MPASVTPEAGGETRGCTGPNAEATSEPHLPLSYANPRYNLIKLPMMPLHELPQ